LSEKAQKISYERLANTLPLLLLLALWWGVSAAGWFPKKIMVPPPVILDSLWHLVLNGQLWDHLSASLGRLFIGYAIGAGLGLVLGAGMGLSREFRAFVHPTFQLLRQFPTIALLPAFVMLFGVGESLKIILVAKATMLPIGLATHEGIRGISRTYFDLAAVYKISPRQMFLKVVLPATFPPILTGMRLALTRSWMVLVGAELLVAQNGLGQMMEWGRQMFRIDIVLVGVVLTGLIGFAFDKGLRAVEHRFVRW